MRLRAYWPAAGQARVEVFDTAGRRVLTLLDAQVTPGPWSTEADLSASAPGVYMVRASQLGREVSRRFARLR